MSKQRGRTVEATKTSLTVLDVIAELGGEAETAEIANELPFAVSTVYKHLRTLENEGFITKCGGQYRIGSKCLELGGYVRQYDDIYRTAEADLQEMANETGELANLMVEEDGLGVYIHTAKGEKAVNIDTSLGKRMPLNFTALGKAILSTMTEERVDEILDQRGLPRQTPQTITDRDEFDAELERIRDSGVAYERNQRVDGICCVAAPITVEGKRHAAISITGPERRMSEERLQNELKDVVQRVANVIEINLTYE
ncbi:IclR family transcriptional regulator [Haladaptatus sp. W1]|uniref:IclR family transcriptional regulator n=1 Tax=Haladaptatus sp. W1 TaxID=1897478 RepID=UPI000849E88E|nr:IclR family transcriptional regulator [Haladaptatus sp. W1]ODR82178.1 IclR family transcriptional regulator [Haladaptatus sp. W1]